MKNNRVIYITKPYKSAPYAWTFSDNSQKGNVYHNLTLETMRRIASLSYDPDIRTKLVMINHFELTAVISRV